MTIELAALFHQTRAPYLYPLSESHLRITLKAKAGDLHKALILFDDPYQNPPDQDEAAPMTWLGSDGLHDYWGATLCPPLRRLRYQFLLTGKNGETVRLNESGVGPFSPKGKPFQFPYLHRGDLYRQPAWIRDAVFYQIFPDRFYPGTSEESPLDPSLWDQEPTADLKTGGNLRGIRLRLDYLQELGVNALYATPLFLSPSNHKYDTSDYYQVDPDFGTNEELSALVSEVHTKGFHFLLDGVFNHAGKEWFAFRDVLANGEASAYRDWFYHLESFPVTPDVCNYETFGKEIATMPKLDTSHPDCAEYFLQVAEHWIREAGVDGWRLDVANEVNHPFWRRFRERVKAANPKAFLLGEIWHDATPWLEGNQFDPAMNYPWRDATLGWLKGDLDAQQYDYSLTRQRFAHPLEVRRGLLNLLGSHDTSRVLTEVAAEEKAALAAVLLLTSPGVPMVFYGDEIGLEGSGDVGTRVPYPWHAPERHNQTLFALYKRLIWIRREAAWLNDGGWTTLEADPATNVFAFRRDAAPLEFPEKSKGAPALYVFLNNSGRTRRLSLPVSKPLFSLLKGLPGTGSLEENGSLTLPPYGYALLTEDSALEAKIRATGASQTA